MATESNIFIGGAINNFSAIGSQKGGISASLAFYCGGNYKNIFSIAGYFSPGIGIYAPISAQGAPAHWNAIFANINANLSLIDVKNVVVQVGILAILDYYLPYNNANNSFEQRSMHRFFPNIGIGYVATYKKLKITPFIRLATFFRGLDITSDATSISSLGLGNGFDFRLAAILALGLEYKINKWISYNLNITWVSPISLNQQTANELFVNSNNIIMQNGLKFYIF
jgi:hypothetical protein